MTGTANSGGAADAGGADFGWFFRRDESGGALEAAAKFGKSLRARAVVALHRNLLEKRGELRGAAVIARTDGKIEQALEDRGVARRALQDGFQEIDRFLRQAIAGKQIDIGQSLRDVSLSFFFERRLGRHGAAGLAASSVGAIFTAGEISPEIGSRPVFARKRMYLRRVVSSSGVRSSNFS